MNRSLRMMALVSVLIFVASAQVFAADIDLAREVHENINGVPSHSSIV